MKVMHQNYQNIFFFEDFGSWNIPQIYFDEGAQESAFSFF